MWTEIFQGAKGISQILGGLNNSKTAGKIAKLQRETAEMQFNYNKKQIKEATETNINNFRKQAKRLGYYID